MTVPQWIDVPRVTGTKEEAFYGQGKVVFYYDNIYQYRVAYSSNNQQDIRLGVVWNTYEDYTFVAVSHNPVVNLQLKLVSPYMTTVAEINFIMQKIPDGYDGYFGTCLYGRDRMTFKMLKVFENVDECAKALSIGETPESGDGLVVTAIASPISPDSHDEGVVVYAVAQLLDPNQQGGTSIPGGGEGTFNDASDPIPIPDLPSISTVDTGLVTLFRPTQEELMSLGSYLWTHLTDFWENLQKLFTNPMDYFVAFNIFPVVPDVLLSRRIFIGNWGTEISMSPVANQWYEFNCGTVLLPKYWGSALDYAPNTKVQLMLPYIGSVQLNTDEVMGKQIGIKYRIDLLSGSCVAMITVNGNVYYQFTGECAVSVPLTGADWSRIYSAVVGAVGTAITGGIGAVATGSAGGAAMSAIAAGKAAYSAGYAGQNLAKVAEVTKGMRGAPAARAALTQAMEASAQAAQNAASASGTVANGIRATRIANTVNNTVGQVMSAKTNVPHSGSISGSAGMLGIRDAYLIVEYPNQSLAQDYRHFVGYPSNMYARLGTLSGYTEVEQVIPEGIWGTDDELAELVDALKGGVYL